MISSLRVTELLDKTFLHILGVATSSGCTLRTLNGGGFDLDVYDWRFPPNSPVSKLDLYIPIE
ncbi:hypothetical protein [Paenibacillus sp. 22594]|uniref:hypothetical protein n=1 Tax=Paenibacillus sp. 22594 TaxID=3453947 RepID=UPI003F850E2D